jgi:hypothetical protein
MKFKKARFRANTSIALALSIIAVFSLGSLAAASHWEDSFPSQGLPSQAPTGLVNVSKNVTINGNAVASGVTFVSGNSIAVGHDGYASIELGPLGRIQLQEHTGITAVFTTTSFQMTLDECGTLTQTLPPGVEAGLIDPHYDRVHINVYSGQVHIKWDGGKEQDLAAGQDKTVENFVSLYTAGATSYKVSCSEPHKAFFLVPLGAAGLAGLIVGLTHGEDEVPAISPSVP